MPDLNPDDQFRKEWNNAQRDVDNIRKLFHTFTHTYETDVIDGSKKKGIPPRPDLQMQRRLYRAEAVRLNYVQISLLQRAYVQDGDRKRFRKELFE